MIIVVIIALEYTKQVVHNAVAYHSLTNDQPYPEHQPLAKFPPSL